MTKFKNRKGLALGSIFALVISAFVGVAPAKAAVGDLIIEPAYGPSTNFTALASDSASVQHGIVLNTTYKSGVSASKLKYKVQITNADLTTASVSFAATMTSSTAISLPSNAITNSRATSAAYGDSGDADFDQIRVIKNTNEAGVAAEYNLMLLSAWRSDTTESITVTVTAWNDVIDNDVMDSSEVVVSAPATVTFIHPEAVALGVAVTQPTLGDSTISANITMGSLNLKNYVETNGSGPSVQAGIATSNTTITGSSSSAVVAYVALTDKLVASLDVSDTALSRDTVTADEYFFYAKFNGAAASAALNGIWAGNVASALSTSVEVVAATVATYSLAVVTSTTVAQDTGLTGANNIKALAGTKTLSFKFAGYTDANTRSVAIGQGVVGTVTLTDVAGGLGTTALTTPAATTLAATGVNSRTFDVTSDINGEWSFVITADKAVAGETFNIAFSAENVASATKTVTWEAEAITLVQGPNKSAMKIANGGSISVNYSIVNQWGQVPTGDYQLEVTRARSSGTRTTALGTSADWSYNVPLEADGTATVTIIDNGSATVEGVDTVTVTLQKKATAGGAYVDVSGTSADTFTLTYETDLNTAVLETTVNNNGAKRGTTTVKALALETETLRNFDSRIDSVDALEFAASNAYTSATATTATELVAITGYVKTAAGVGITGVPVVISGSGLMFSDGASGTATTVRHSLNSMILTTGTGGAYTFYVRGNLSGTKTVTVTAAGKSNNVSLTFAAGSTAAANMAITAPATSDAGKVIDVVVKVTDAFGNPASGVGVSFKSKGAGYLNALSGTSDADGEVIVKLITLTNDSGTATITATATLAGVSTAKVATVTVGAAAASADQKVNAGSFKGYVALYAKGYAGQRMSAKVGADWVVVESLASDFERVVEFTGAGYTISVPIYIDRVLVDTIVVTTK